jgi:hypothetical protein
MEETGRQVKRRKRLHPGGATRGGLGRNGSLGVVVYAAVNSAANDDTYGRLLRTHTETYARWLLHR